VRPLALAAGALAAALTAACTGGGSTEPTDGSSKASFAPSAAAVFTAAPRLAKLLLSASTKRSEQFGQIALAICRSSALSCAQPQFARGKLVPPLWSTFRKQPFAVVQGGRPNVLR